MFSLRQPAPVAIMTVLLSKTAPFSNVTLIASSVFSISVARMPVIASMSYWSMCAAKLEENSEPVVSLTVMKFSIPAVSLTWPPIRSATIPVRKPLRAV